MRLNHLSASQPKSFRRVNRAKLIVAAAAAVSMGTASASFAQTTWSNVASDWSTVGNWGGGLPSSVLAAVLPGVAGPGVNPDVAGSVAAQGLTINNTVGNAYSITGTGTISLGAGGLNVSGGGTTTIQPGLTLTTAATFNIGASTTTTLTGPLNLGGFQLTKGGTGTLVLNSASTGVAPTQAIPVVINAGTLEIGATNALGVNAAGTPSVTVNSGGTLAFRSSNSVNVTFGTPFDTAPATNSGGLVILKNNSTIAVNEDAVTPANTGTVIFGGGRSPRITNGATANIQVNGGDSYVVFQSFVGNETETLAPSGSNINVTGTGIFQMSGGTAGTNAYTGNWTINHGEDSEGFTGVTLMNGTAVFGTRTGGALATVAGVSGIITDMRSTSADQIRNPLTLSGAQISSSALFDAAHTNSYWASPINVTAASNISTSDVFGGDNIQMNFSGKLTGTGALFLFGDAVDASSVFTQSVVKFSNNALGANASNYGGNIVVTDSVLLDISNGIAGGTNPIGGDATNSGALQIGSTIDPSNSTLKVELSSSGSNAQNQTYQFTDILLASAFTAPSTGATIVVGAGTGSGTGNIIQFGQLVTFEPDQTLVVKSSDITKDTALGVGTTFLTGNLTITADSVAPADVIIAGDVLDFDTLTPGSLTKEGTNGMLIVGQVVAQGLKVNSGLVLSQEDGGVNKVVNFSVGGVSTTGTYDIGNNALVVDYDAAATATDRANAVAALKALIITGRGVANLNGVYDYDTGLETANSITSYIADADNTTAGFNQFAVGFLDNKKLFELTGQAYTQFYDPNNTSFFGVDVDESSIIVAYTYAGDANLDGIINAADYALINGGFAQTGAFAGFVSWLDGDFNLDGVINALDYAIIDFGFLKQNGYIHGGPPSLVPEPTSLALLGLGASALMGRRRRQG